MSTSYFLVRILYSRLDSRGRGRVQLAAELPLVYTAGRWPTLPEVRYPLSVDELAGQPRRTRQSELETEPFLQSIPAYRYVQLPPSAPAHHYPASFIAMRTTVVRAATQG